MINLFYPFLPREAIDEVSEVLRTRWIGQGPKVDLFEKEFCKLFNIPYAVSLNSGTSALDTAYDLIGLKAGDEVITTPLTCTATNLPLLRRGVKLVWADILSDTLCIDPSDVSSKLSSKTKAIVQVHLGGIEAKVDDPYTANYGHIPIVSDACQALGIFSGDYTCCSFQAIKHITTGDGGMLVVNNAEEAKRAKLLRWFGIDRDKKIANNWQAYTQRQMTFDIDELGTKRHMTDIAAVMGLVGLKHYQRVIEHREKLWHLYHDTLLHTDGIRVIGGARKTTNTQNSISSWSHKNTYWLATFEVERRDDFARVMFEADIDTNLVQVRNDIYKVFGGKRADLPVMNEIEHKYISLPLGMHINEDEVNYICDTINKGW